MKTFNYSSEYDNYMDIEVIELCNAINSLPGLKTSESCSGHNKGFFDIYFKIMPCQNHEGLFFLTRCVDRRYWQYGDQWNIKLMVGDAFDNKILPICFILESKSKGKDACQQADDLVKNMEHHLNHKNFIKGYNIDLSKFNLKEEDVN